MADRARSLEVHPRREFWRPVDTGAARVINSLTTSACCPRCGTEYLVAARYCHLCGRVRPGEAERAQHDFPEILDLDSIRQRLRLPVASMVFFIAAMACVAGALLTGITHRASTVLDWQAVQTWRVEWLLGAAVGMLAALLVKR